MSKNKRRSQKHKSDPTRSALRSIESIYILGAGPAGMATAMELSKAGKTATIVERDSRVGGLAQTLEFKEGDLVFRTDIGPHRFFSKNQYLYDFIEDLLDEKWIRVPRQTRQLIEGKYYDYPIKALQAFKNIGPLRAVKMVASYGVGAVQYRVFNRPVESFQDYIVANFGYELGKFNMLNYTEKIWGVSCKQLHPDWARQRIKGLNLTTALKSALFGGGAKQAKTLVDEFYYPQYGTGLIYETIRERITNAGFSFHMESEPTKIEHEHGRITRVTLNTPDGEKTIEPDTLVSSIPITHFMSLLDPAPPAAVLEALAGLSWRAQVYLFVTLDREKVTDDNWIYIPDSDVPVGRIAEMKNFSTDMCPEGKTSLFLEFFVTEGDEVWNMSKEELFEVAMKDMERLGLFTRDEVRNYYHIKRRHVYPVYDLGYPERLAVVKEYLDTFTNLYYIGRPGRFKYNNQDHSIEMGIAAARGLVQGERPDFDSIGGEQEYFEKGKLAEEKSVKAG